MRNLLRRIGSTWSAGVLGVLGATTAPGVAAVAEPQPTVRFAVLDTELARGELGGLAKAMRAGDAPDIRRVAEVVQRVRPDVLLLQGVDFDATRETVRLFRRNYLTRSQNGARPIDYPFAVVPRVNTGVASAADLDRNGEVGGPGDAFGPGAFPGQDGLLLLSRLPLRKDQAHTFRRLRWAEVPGLDFPDHLYDAGVAEVMRLSTRTHVDVPVELGDSVVRLLLSGPRSPAADDEVSTLRNAAELGFWHLYLSGRTLRNDEGDLVTLPMDVPAVLIGQWGVDPFDGPVGGASLHRLLGHPRGSASADGGTRMPPASRGGLASGLAAQPGSPGAAQRGDPAADTTATTRIGPLRTAYVLPMGPGVEVVDQGVYWPIGQEPAASVVAQMPQRMVWVDLRLSGE